jgi:hypothetical protein
MSETTLFSFSSSSASGDKAPLVRKISGRRAKRRVPIITSVGSSLNMQGPTGKTEDEEASAVSTRITRSRSTTTGSCRRTALYARVSPQPTASLKNEAWDEVVTTFSVPNRAASYKLAKHVQNVSGQISDDSGSDRLQSSHMPRKTALKSSLFSDVTHRSKVAKHVQFTFKDLEVRYDVTKDDIKNSWLDIDVSRAIEAAENESRDMIVSFGPTGRFTVSDMDACKNGKGYMVRIQKSRLINEMLGQRTNLRQSVLEEQAHQKREGVVDAEEIRLVASKHSKWGEELAKSSWWLYRT